MNYGAAPENIGHFSTSNREMMFVLYMPIRLAGQHRVTIPDHLLAYEPLVQMALDHEGDRAIGQYIYLTVKRLYVQKGHLGSRLGWHTDGFGTQDVNYIWSDGSPTEFCIQPFHLTEDHVESMREMEEQAQVHNIVTYPVGDVLRLDARHVHRCPENPQEGYRTFARISFSNNPYDMEGNAHNYLLDYDWDMAQRGDVRNDVSTK